MNACMNGSLLSSPKRGRRPTWREAAKATKLLQSIPSGLDKAARRFNHAADERKQVARAAAHLIGALRAEAKANLGRVDFDTFAETLERAGSLKEAFRDALSPDLFAVLDTDKNGSLSLNELEHAIRELVDPAAVSEVDLLLSMGNDVMRTSMKQMTDSLSGQAARVIELFKKWDRDGDGTIDRDEFFKAMPRLGMVGNVPAEVDALFAKFDPDGSGKITFRELYRMIRHSPGIYIPPKQVRIIRKEELVNLDQLRKDAKAGLLHMEFRHEILLGGRKRIQQQAPDPEGETERTQKARLRDFLPMIPL